MFSILDQKLVEQFCVSYWINALLNHVLLKPNERMMNAPCTTYVTDPPTSLKGWKEYLLWVKTVVARVHMQWDERNDNVENLTSNNYDVDMNIMSCP